MSDAERTKELRALYITHPQRARHRLPVLAAWLREVSGLVNGAKFNLSKYAIIRRADILARPPIPKSAAEASACGFEGCALGWAPVCPRLRRAGLRGSKACGYHSDALFSSALEEAEDFFGITSEVSACLFGSTIRNWRGGAHVFEFTGQADPRDPIAAAERVERFMADVGIEPLPHEPPPSHTTT